MDQPFLKSVYMVKSLLSSTIVYPENRHLLTEDKNSEASLYEITLFEKDETIALGQPVYTYIDQNIIYYPIYLVKNNKVANYCFLNTET